MCSNVSFVKGFLEVEEEEDAFAEVVVFLDSLSVFFERIVRIGMSENK